MKFNSKQYKSLRNRLVFQLMDTADDYDIPFKEDEVYHDYVFEVFTESGMSEQDADKGTDEVIEMIADSRGE